MNKIIQKFKKLFYIKDDIPEVLDPEEFRKNFEEKYNNWKNNPISKRNDISFIKEMNDWYERAKQEVLK